MVREDVEFVSQGDLCAAWLYRPDDAQGTTGCVVMGHGFSAVRDQGLDRYAERFAEAGLAALAFDYRGLGDSAGAPRGLITPARQRADYHAAIAYARNCDGIDPRRIAIWGSSFSGGNVVLVAAEDPHIAAIVSNCPAIDPWAALPRLFLESPRRYAAVIRVALADQIGAWLGRPPRLIPLAAKEGAAFLPHAGIVEGMLAITPPQSMWTNAVVARSLLSMAGFRPIRHAKEVVAPWLVCICDRDVPAPPQYAARAAQLALRGEAKHYDCGHFDIYYGPYWEQAVTDQTAFLLRHLNSRSTADSATA